MGNHYEEEFHGLAKMPYTGPNTSANRMLQQGLDVISNRAASRDVEQERSMAATVKAFNALYGKTLTEEEGWMFMVLLKASRAKGGAFREDDYVDGAAYFALAGEAASEERRLNVES